MSELKFKSLIKSLIKWLKLKNINESHLLLIAGLSDGNIHHAKFLISQSFEKFLLLLGEAINIITNKNSEEWRICFELLKNDHSGYRTFFFPFFHA